MVEEAKKASLTLVGEWEGALEEKCVIVFNDIIVLATQRPGLEKYDYECHFHLKDVLSMKNATKMNNSKQTLAMLSAGDRKSRGREQNGEQVEGVGRALSFLFSSQRGSGSIDSPVVPDSPNDR
tara:strand:- start:407 stop:778 length:372 start_codon:yes stop_codon:yes gene_type:complete